MKRRVPRLTKPKPVDKLVTAVSILLTLGGGLMIVAGFTLANQAIGVANGKALQFASDVVLGLGLALVPSGILSFLFEWFVFGDLIAGLRDSTDGLRAEAQVLEQDLKVSTDALKDQTDSLETEISALKVSTDFLKQSSELGLDMIYANRAEALEEFSDLMRREVARKDGPGRLMIVGSSLKGLLESVKDMPGMIRSGIETSCDMRVLLTHPQYSQYRENQEDRPPGAIEDEIFDGIRALESSVAHAYPDAPDRMLAPRVKLYKGTPTCFMITAGDRMLLNPYPYEQEAYKSFCLSVRRVDGPATSQQRAIYGQFVDQHFEEPWKRNSVPYQHYPLEGPDPSQAWARDTCYGDVFVVQDAGHFYLAVYLLGRGDAEVRGMPYSVWLPSQTGASRSLKLPDAFHVKLLTVDQTWRNLEADIGLLRLSSDRRRAKVSGQVVGNLLNEYLMLGLFDSTEQIMSPFQHPDFAPDDLRGEQLPIFYVWLGDKRDHLPEPEVAEKEAA